MSVWLELAGAQISEFIDFYLLFQTPCELHPRIRVIKYSEWYSNRFLGYHLSHRQQWPHKTWLDWNSKKLVRAFSHVSSKTSCVSSVFHKGEAYLMSLCVHICIFLITVSRCLQFLLHFKVIRVLRSLKGIHRIIFFCIEWNIIFTLFWGLIKVAGSVNCKKCKIMS